ncbi:AAA family ATPase [Aneurinibacillus aneurinilyticus]|uniref:AAA family ATPase n=1 Tax=Aneurinibacillus aneurinilyticus TaxID=1391 RepID=UPI0035259DF9
MRVQNSVYQHISQFNMSSGECMLITLLHFVYNVLIRNNNKTGRNVVFFIDEVELALHPSAINRLVTFLEELTASYELTVYFSTHSSELIRRIKPRNLYLIENEDGKVSITNPCYPSYAIRDIYKEDGFDYLLLVEDELAKKVVYKVLYASTLLDSNLVHVLPSGDWGHTLKLQQDFQKNTVLETGRQVISILDGDVKDKANNEEKYKALKKLFLPIPSLEKYLYRKLITDNDRDFQKRFGDRFFKTRSIKDVLTDYKNNYKVADDKKGKNLFGLLTSVLYKTGLNEDEFVIYLCDEVYKDVDFTKFQSALEKMIGNYSTIK